MRRPTPPPTPSPAPRARAALTLGLLLLAPGALAAEPPKPAPGKPTPWTDFLPVPARLPAAKPKPAEPAACQPENFIPGEPRSKLVPDPDTRELLLEGEPGITVSINDTRDPKAPPVKTLGPYALHEYAFSCASSESYVLDISRDGKRHALYQHVNWYTWHPTRPLLFFSQSERKGKRYQDFTGLVSLDGKRKVRLPALGCTGYGYARLEENHLITYGEPRGAKDKQRTEVCVWNLDGKLLHRFNAELGFSVASDYQLIGPIGLLPRQPHVFYHRYLDPDRMEEVGCELRLQNLQRPEQFKKLRVGDDCMSAKYDLQTLTLDGP